MGKWPPLQNQVHNAMAIIKVDCVAQAHVPVEQTLERSHRTIPRHVPAKVPHVNRSRVPRSFVSTPLELPVSLRSIIAEALKSPEALDRLLAAPDPSSGLTQESRAALGLFKLLPPADAARALDWGENVRDGP